MVYFKDIEFQFKPFYTAKKLYFLPILYSEQLQLFIEASTVTAFRHSVSGPNHHLEATLSLLRHGGEVKVSKSQKQN